MDKGRIIKLRKHKFTAMFYLFVFSMKLQKFQHSLSKVGKKEKEKENTNSLTAIAATSAAYSSFCTLTRKTG